ncbi:MAG: 2-hydroxyacyl-CoA dehydratase subunit D [Bacillota bacterium]
MSTNKKSLESSRMLSQVIRDYYANSHQAKESGTPIVWVTGLFPTEILYAMDIVPIFPENYAAASAAKGLGAGLCEKAEGDGFSADLCSYFRVNYGTVLQMEAGGREELPFKGLPWPDLIIVNRCACTTHVKWWEILSRRLEVPFYVWDLPFVADGISEDFVDYGLRGLKGMIAWLEENTGRKLDYDRLRRTMTLSDQAAVLWQEIQNYRKHRPVPVGAGDMFGNLFAEVALGGTQIAVDYLSSVRDEVKNLSQNKVGIIPEERYRLAWGEIAIWYYLGIFAYLQGLGAAVVAEPYTTCYGWGERVDPDMPLESLTVRYLNGWPAQGLKERIRRMVQMVQDYHVDGVIFHSIKTCKPLAIGTLDIAHALKEQLGIPSLIIDGDHVDPRVFAKAQTEVRIQSFLEIIQQ